MTFPTTLGSPISLSGNVSGGQFWGHLTALPNGTFAAAWFDDTPNNDVVLGVFTGDGALIGRRTIATTVSNTFNAIEIKALADGRFVVAWEDVNVGDLQAQIFTMTGLPFGAQFIGNTGDTAGAQSAPIISALSNGDFIIGYSDANDNPDDIDFARFTASGTNTMSNADASTSANATNDAFGSVTVLDNDQQFYVYLAEVGGAVSLKGSILSAGSGSYVGTELTISDAGSIPVGETSSKPLIEMLTDGRVVVVWEDTGSDLNGRILNGDGSFSTNIFSVATGLGRLMGLTALHDGGFMVGWDINGGTDGRLRQYDAGGAPVDVAFATPPGAAQDGGVDLTTLADGRVVASYFEQTGVSGFEVRAQVYDPRTEGLSAGASSFADNWRGTNFDDNVHMGAGNDTFAGAGGNDIIYGELGNDTLSGGDNNDTIYGGGGNDTLNGDAGDDVLHGGSGNDTLIGGADFDYASYQTASAGVTANLANSAANSGEAVGDIYFVEGLIGSSFNDTLVGDSAGNVLQGGDGNDVLDGAGGNDLLLGGNGDDILIGGAGGDNLTGEAGFDYASYQTAGAGVTANLANSAANTGDAVGDTYFVEGLIGSGSADTLIGDSADNILIGGAGGDTLSGAGGLDYASYSTAGAGVTANLANSAVNTGDAAGDIYFVEGLIGSNAGDTLMGDSADNILVGGGGGDNLNGGGGFDYASYFNATAGVTANLANSAVNTGDATGDIFFVQGLIGSNFADTLIGDSFGNVLQGLDGNDRLDGATGNDFLLGGAGADTFVFRSAYGSDRAADFNTGQDKIELQNSLASNFSQAMSFSSQVGADVQFNFASGEVLTLTGIQIANLTSSNFLFVS